MAVIALLIAMVNQPTTSEGSGYENDVISSDCLTSCLKYSVSLLLT